MGNPMGTAPVEPSSLAAKVLAVKMPRTAEGTVRSSRISRIGLRTQDRFCRLLLGFLPACWRVNKDCKERSQEANDMNLISCYESICAGDHPARTHSPRVTQRSDDGPRWHKADRGR